MHHDSWRWVSWSQQTPVWWRGWGSCTAEAASLTSHFTMSVETFCVTTPAQHCHGGHSTKHYNQLHYKQCYPSCGVLYRPVFCHMTLLLTSGWWWGRSHRDLFIDVSAEVVWDLSTRDSCLKVGSCCPIYPYVWVMYYVLSRYLTTPRSLKKPLN